MNTHTRVAIVTGAADGLGKTMTQDLIAHGYHVVAADLDATVMRWKDRSSQVFPVQIDIGNADAGEALVQAAIEEFGQLDAVVNNAGNGGPGTSITDTPLTEFIHVFNINVLGAIRIIQAAIPHLTASPSGRIVNVGSVFAQQPVLNGSAYCMSKAAIHTFTHCLALELGEQHITANTVAPGYIMTKMHESEIELQAEVTGVSREAKTDELRSSVPLKRHGVPLDVAHTVTWLLSPEASYITGQTLGVNGGILMS